MTFCASACRTRFRRPPLALAAATLLLALGACSGRYETNVLGHKSGIYYSTPGATSPTPSSAERPPVADQTETVYVAPRPRRIWVPARYTRRGYWRPGYWRWTRY